ncbi:hypothetical protein H318_00905 [Enterococcus durans IPLA 655]|uniref:Uncharacterized protein n=1 Tax=Enterococcus durans TaxID=53345 RepID=A0AB36SBA8_9ENTE|nr:hypothetical protein LIANG_05455 [Enterococcus durans]EMS76876.1 hypothetical protein H318_00905 [Enterococcus durans IPLA 655]QCJ65157.1 hypothetical protein C9423_13235 [Lactobacillus sp. Koumiss]AKZ47077.1 hypothetical protein LIU_00375 [Enterococcus durans]KST52454.1 hypothetical protein AOY33_05965 [Enterococcus durans]
MVEWRGLKAWETSVRRNQIRSTFFSIKKFDFKTSGAVLLVMVFDYFIKLVSATINARMILNYKIE